MSDLKVHGRLNKPGSILAIGTRKDWPMLRDILDSALYSIGDERMKILRKWAHTEAEAQMSFLTAKERAWLAAHQHITIGINRNWPPMDFVDEEGIAQGIGVGFVQQMNRRLGGVLQLRPGSW